MGVHHNLRLPLQTGQTSGFFIFSQEISPSPSSSLNFQEIHLARSVAIPVTEIEPYKLPTNLLSGIYGKMVKSAKPCCWRLKKSSMLKKPHTKMMTTDMYATVQYKGNVNLLSRSS